VRFRVRGVAASLSSAVGGIEAPRTDSLGGAVRPARQKARRTRPGAQGRAAVVNAVRVKIQKQYWTKFTAVPRSARPCTAAPSTDGVWKNQDRQRPAPNWEPGPRNTRGPAIRAPREYNTVRASSPQDGAASTAPPGVAADHPASTPRARAFQIRVREADFDQGRRGRARAGGRTWLAAKSAACWQLRGHELLDYLYFPTDPSRAYEPAVAAHRLLASHRTTVQTQTRPGRDRQRLRDVDGAANCLQAPLGEGPPRGPLRTSRPSNFTATYYLGPRTQNALGFRHSRLRPPLGHSGRRTPANVAPGALQRLVSSLGGPGQRTLPSHPVTAFGRQNAAGTRSRWPIGTRRGRRVGRPRATRRRFPSTWDVPRAAAFTPKGHLSAGAKNLVAKQHADAHRQPAALMAKGPGLRRPSSAGGGDEPPPQRQNTVKFQRRA